MLPGLPVRRAQRRALPVPAARHGARVQRVQPEALQVCRDALLRLRQQGLAAAGALLAAAAVRLHRGLSRLPELRRRRGARARRRRHRPDRPLDARRRAGLGARQAHRQRAHARPGAALEPPRRRLPRRRGRRRAQLRAVLRRRAPHAAARLHRHGRAAA